MNSQSPSLYEILTGNFSGELSIHSINEKDQVIMSVLDNIQRILNSRAGALTHLPDYGLPDMSKILHGMPGTAHELITTLSEVLLKFEPRLRSLRVRLKPDREIEQLTYTLEAELHGVGLVRYGTEFMPEGKLLIRHLKRQDYLLNNGSY